ncbi:polysaccharide biosynthesis C-terminal domain-containing protein [Candidatus Woesearchaeota archaeon]|nr:polysaccharide biosynthesis C-terminal domain-containing protein [Candidatus Woesearchaeota archaeon]
MEKYYKITRQIGFNYISMFFIFVLSPILIYTLTRNLSIQDFGIYSLIAIAAEMIIIFLDFGMSQFIMTRLPGTTRKNKVFHFGTLYFFNVFLFVAILAVSLIIRLFFFDFGKYILSLFGLGSYYGVILIMIFIIIIGIFIRLNSAYLVANKKLEFQSFIEFMNKGSWILLLIAFLFLVKEITIISVFIIWLIGVLITFIIGFLAIKKDLFYFIKISRHFISSKIIKKIIFFGFPLIFFHIGAYVLAISDRYMLSYFFGNTTVGYYSVAYSVTSIILSIGALISAVFYPYIAEMWNQKKSYFLLFNASLKYGFIIIIPSIVGLFVLRKQIITLISGIPYLPSVSVIPFLVLFPLFAFFTYVCYQILLLRNKTKLIAVIYICAAIFNITFNFILIPRYSMAGAAIATLASYFLTFLALFLINKKFIKLDFTFLRFGRIIFASISMGLLIFWLNPQVFITKIVTIILSALFYFILLFATRTFVKSEKRILSKLLKGGRLLRIT